MLSLLAAILWLPMTSHCELESIPGLEFLACAAETGANHERDSHCDDSCCSAERAPFKSETRQILLPPALVFVNATVLPIAEERADESQVDLQTAAPLELIQSRHFVYRAASPPRAPSFAS